MASPLPSSSRKTKKLGEILVGEGLITADQLERALLEQSRTDQLLGRILIDLKMVKESDLMAALAKQIGFRFVDLNDHQIDPSAAMLIPEQVARRYRALPIGYEDSRLLVSMADPANLFALDDIRTITGMDLQPVVNIAERRVPQDGRIGLTVGGKSIDLRLATLPTVYGEKVVIRILDKSSVLLKLEELGFLDQSFKRYQEAYTKPYGAILVTGPTGSGKSTTLYATLNLVNKADRNIITVEDPVEYRLPGVNQMQMNVRAGLTFASALRSILRADPDVVLVSEIRDHETALIAIEAALTGHLVLSTLHTNDAPSSLPRLVEMGVETYLVASAIDCVVAQRLARKLCPKCREGYRPNQSELEQAGFPEFMWDDVKELFRPVGCTACSKTGCRGRLGMYEVMNMSEEIERLVVERAPSEEIRRSARRDGMITLREDGLEKVRLGITSVEEVLRVVS